MIKKRGSIVNNRLHPHGSYLTYIIDDQLIMNDQELDLLFVDRESDDRVTSAWRDADSEMD